MVTWQTMAQVQGASREQKEMRLGPSWRQSISIWLKVVAGAKLPAV